MNSRRLLLTSLARVTSGRGTDLSGVQPKIGPDSGRRQVLAATRAPEVFSLLLSFHRVALWASTPLFDHLVSAGEESGRDVETERFGGLPIDREIKTCRRLE